jgi:hypothetical protein
VRATQRDQRPRKHAGGQQRDRPDGDAEQRDERVFTANDRERDQRQQRTDEDAGRDERHTAPGGVRTSGAG